MMHADEFTAALGPLATRHRVRYYDVTDSSNTRAARAVADGAAQPGDCFIAGRQTAGRGANGRAWASAAPLGLWLSIVFADPPPARALSLLPAVALATLLRDEYHIAAHLKWPNDVLVGTGEQTRKIAGILVESVSGPAGRASIVGVGVNLNQQRFEPPLDTVAASVRMITGGPVGIAQFFGLLMNGLRTMCESGVDLPACWAELSRMPGRTVLIARRGDGDAQSVRVDGLDADGRLLVTHADGRREQLVGVSGLHIDPHF